ncbi:hypothetical protein TSAR_005974 [Trichomalopsis sarcophagae]|uniref:Uncharacterized protein n=1 Tax=Trichomalopsis sarcophagae TaxID=543379 RepID=A0A232EN11_9HYME|nr:hypothetical protein TSAR_005974 [Trichomalopsis sarcophagae]
MQLNVSNANIQSMLEDTTLSIETLMSPLKYVNVPATVVKFEHTSIVKHYLNQLNWAVKSRNQRWINFIASAIQNFEGYRESPLLIAIRVGESLAIIRLLVKYGAYIDTRDTVGNTVLHYAAKYSRKDVFDFFLKHGADPNEINYNGQTALHLVYNSPDKLDFIRFLLESGLDPDIMKIRLLRCGMCHTVGKVLSNTNHNCKRCWNKKQESDKLQLCFDYGANVNTLDVKGNTILSLTHQDQTVWIQPIIEQIAKTETLGETIRRSDLRLINNNSTFLSYYRKCRGELAAMRVKVFFQDVSFYDILTANCWRMLNYVRQKDLVQAFEQQNCDSKYPIYSKSMRNRFRRTLNKLELIKEGVATLQMAFSIPKNNNQPILDTVASFLNERNMLRWIDKND